mmetsp:Transcript_21784/g.54290  ORF Transcript_21784/g.54290 Transcript_21784/m.54290 type:complete len:429 (-) Transcript_21784:320-1606(-)
MLALLLAEVGAQKPKKEAGLDESPKYSVQLLSGPIPSMRRPPQQQGVVMTRKDGKRYRCYPPSSKNATEATDESETTPVPHVGSYVQPLVGACFYRLEGWWTYEFCFPKSIRQFHQEKIKSSGQPDSTSVTQDYLLGRYWSPDTASSSKQPPPPPAEAEAPKEGAVKPAQDASLLRGELLEDAKTRRVYWKQVYGNGTHCDLTEKPRESEVRLQCAPSEPSFLVSVEEVSTCRYLVVFSTNLLCNHRAFIGEKDKASVEEIQCEPLDEAGQPLPAVERAPVPPKSTASPSKEGADAANKAEVRTKRPTDVAYSVGECLIHHKFNYRGVIVGVDEKCKQSDAWIRMMGVDELKYGRNQPFYHVLTDTRDRPGAQITYVAQENIMRDTPSEPLQHPMIAELFAGFDSSTGSFQPKEALQDRFLGQKDATS